MPGPPPPPPPTFNLGGGGSAEQGRGALLQSIRAGKPLKKTVTVDKSAPALSGKIISSTTSSTSASSTNPTLKTSLSNNGNGCANSNNGNPVGLGGLFAGGMPKLKPTGLRNNLNTEKSNQQPVIGSATLPNINKRGPPPVPPPATQKPQIFTAVPAQVAQENTSNSESPRGYGKPTIAPKPPGQQQQQQKPSPPPKKLSLMTNNSVSRAQSMRLTRSPPVLAPAPPSFHQSKEVLYDPQPRPVTRALRPPGVRPPSPPVSKTNGTNSSSVPITRVAPPPPCRAPSIPPPPPPLPHRGSTSSSSSSNLQQPVPHTRLAPPVPPSVTPPTPPTRNQSLRNGQNNSNPNTATNFVNNNASPAEFEARFIDFFHSIANFPAPEAFRNVTKVYNSRTVAAAKQQAPAPPMRSVSNAGTSLSGTKSQWSQQQQNATSSAC